MGASGGCSCQRPDTIIDHCDQDAEKSSNSEIGRLFAGQANLAVKSAVIVLAKFSAGFPRTVATAEISTNMLSQREIEFVTRKWIGVSGGYLGDFSYRSHYEFYYDYCGLEEVDPYKYEGTTRQRFETILAAVDPATKARILRGVLKKFPPGSTPDRTPEREKKMREFIARCEGGSPVAAVTPAITSAVVERALADAEVLLRSGPPVSAVDRIHTAFHGYLKAVCDRRGLSYESDAATTRLFKLLRAACPELKPAGALADQSDKILNSLAAVVDATNPLRNRGSVAHANEELLAPEEAMLCINAVRTLLHYLNGKLGIRSVEHVSPPEVAPDL